MYRKICLVLRRDLEKKQTEAAPKHWTRYIVQNGAIQGFFFSASINVYFRNNIYSKCVANMLMGSPTARYLEMKANTSKSSKCGVCCCDDFLFALFCLLVFLSAE